LEKSMSDLSSSDSSARASAAWKLSQMGNQALPALEKLVKTLENDDIWSVRVNAVWAIGRIGEVGLPFVIKALEDQDYRVGMQI